MGFIVASTKGAASARVDDRPLRDQVAELQQEVAELRQQVSGNADLASRVGRIEDGGADGQDLAEVPEVVPKEGQPARVVAVATGRTVEWP